jgi:hypothetical protein
MSSVPVRLAAVGTCCAVAAGLFWSVSTSSQPSLARADEAGRKAAAPAPVEEDMHEFMEYAFQPAYLRLQAAIAAEPKDNAGWKAIKADALGLAEGGNLLLLRPSADDAADWTAHSVQVRQLGSQLYAAARKKDFANARKSYEAMIVRCNACHDQFAGGEHQLEP